MINSSPITCRHFAWRSIRAGCALALAISLLAPVPFGEAASSAVFFVRSTLHRVTPDEDGFEDTHPPSRKIVPRIKLLLSNTHELAFGEAILAATLLDPSVASAEKNGERRLIIKGLSAGETILIISGPNTRSTYVIEVLRPARPRRSQEKGAGRALPVESFSGFYSLYFSPGFDGAPSLARHTFEFNQKLAKARTLRAGGELFNFMGGGERALAQPLWTSFGAGRLRLGLDSPESSFDLLDSELAVSRLTFNHYTMRGPHFVSKTSSRWRGLEIFAGRARPQLSLFNRGEGTLAGALIPLEVGPSWRIRVGAFFVSPAPQRETESGIIWHADARYAPDDKTTAEAEADYAKGHLSWRARLDLRRGPVNLYGELFRLDRDSPLVFLGAQSGGRKLDSFGLQWRALPHFIVSGSYHSASNSPPSAARRFELNSRTVTATASYAPARGTRLSFSFNQQELEQPAARDIPFLLSLRTRTATLRYGQRIAAHWTNDLDARFILSREEETAEQMTRGLSLREQLRYSWRRGSLTGFVNYRSNTPSLTSLLLRNPALLPLETRAAFAADPLRFLLLNGDALPQLLTGVELPMTRSTEAGLRLQAAFSRLNMTGEIHYSTGEVAARAQRNMIASFSANLKLDAANSVQVSSSSIHSFDGNGNRTALTVSFTHRFGVEGHSGFQFSRLLGLTARASVKGRVFLDTNANGKDDPEEPGLAGMKVQLDANHTLMTDSSGHFNFSALEPGEHAVALVHDELGVQFRASNTTLRQLVLEPRETVNLSFGLTNVGFAQGRIFNDLLLAGEKEAGDAPGVGGVKVFLRRISPGRAAMTEPLTQAVNASGLFEFRNLSPGSYVLEVDPASIPADFHLPGQTAWPLNINPLQGSFLDLPLIAQRAVSGIVFIDKDGDGRFDENKDQVVVGARVIGGSVEARTDSHGSYILRNLPAGKLTVRAFLPNEDASKPVHLELGPNPVFKRDLNLSIGK